MNNVQARNIPVRIEDLTSLPAGMTPGQCLTALLRPLVYLRLWVAYRGLRRATTPEEVARILHRLYDNSKQKAQIEIHKESNSVTVEVLHCQFNKLYGSALTRHFCQLDYDYLTAMPRLTIRKNQGSTIAYGGTSCVTEIFIKPRAGDAG